MNAALVFMRPIILDMRWLLATKGATERRAVKLHQFMARVVQLSCEFLFQLKPA
jgi:hypothetical protein